MNSPKRILVIYENRDDNPRITIRHHYEVMESSDLNHEITYYNSANIIEKIGSGRQVKSTIPEIVEKADPEIIILHYTFLGQRANYYERFLKWRKAFEWIGSLDAVKIAIPQDEFSMSELLDEWLYVMGVNIIFSIHDKTISPLYPVMSEYGTIYSCFPGYIDQNTLDMIQPTLLPIESRSLDIVYRATKLPYWLGSFGQRKHEIGRVFNESAPEQAISSDISTEPEDVIPGIKWLDFLASGKTVIGSEGGSSVIDWRGEYRSKIQQIQQKVPDVTFEELNERLPAGWNSYKLFTLTPRHLEAAMTKTCQVLLEGEYRGILIPDTHYIPVKHDYSNLDEVFEKIRDVTFLQKMADQTYEDIVVNGTYTYRDFAQMIEQAVDRFLGTRTQSETIGGEDGLLRERVNISHSRESIALKHDFEYAQSERVARINSNYLSKVYRFLRLNLWRPIQNLTGISSR